MKDMHYVLTHFFTHKDFLADPDLIPGTMFTPLHLIFAVLFISGIIACAKFTGKRRKLVKPVLVGLWLVMVLWEIAIFWWDSTAGIRKGPNLLIDLPLYPCSLYLYTLPFIIWGKGNVRQAACGYISTLGLLGAVINLLIPAARLTDYSCISFAGLHTLCFHGSMFFTFLVLMISGYHRYDHVTGFKDLLLPCVPSLIQSIPSNILNYTIGSDYMYFRGEFPVVAMIFKNTEPILITISLYILYILVPALFYLPAYLHRRRHGEDEDLMITFSARLS